MQYPPHVHTEAQKKRFIGRATQYFLKSGRLYKRNASGIPLRVILHHNHRYTIMLGAHEKAGHRGVEAVYNTLKLRFFWPHMELDIKKHIQSCHECQIRSLIKPQVPITVSTPATIWTKVYLDIMYMPRAQGFRYIVAARDDLSRVTEVRALRKANADSLAKFFWEQIYCRYGVIGHVVTDNGPETMGAFDDLVK